MGIVYPSGHSCMRRDLLPVVAVLFAALVLWDPPLSWFRDGIIYVSPEGSDWSSGRTADSAVATIQRAADMVAPGETVMLLPGIYREEVHVRRGGAAGKPVVFKALQPGTVTISGAAPGELVDKLGWRAEGGKVWSAATPWPIYHVIGDGENFYHVRWADGRGDNVYDWVGTTGRAGIVRDLSDRPDARGVFAYEQGRLYVAFADGRSPRFHELQVNREIPRPYASWSIRSANVWVEAAHVRFEGLRFHLGVGSGVLLWKARDIIVSDSMFTGAMFGISGFPRVSLPRDVVVERSFYNNYPQHQWLRGWLTGEEIYDHHSNSTLIGTYGDGIVARYNLVTHAGDGMELSTPAAGAAKGVEIYGNLLAGGTDDAFELDGPAIRVHVHHNLVSDFSVDLGLSPVLAGPVHVRENLFLHPADNRPGAHLKLMNPWAGRKGSLSGPIRNITVERNVFSGKWLCFCTSPVENVRVENNVFADLREDGRFGLPQGAATAGNAFLAKTGVSDRPEAACALKGKAGLPRGAPHAFTDLPTPAAGGEGTVRVVAQRPGPAWLDYLTDPASRDIAGLAEEWLRVAGRCD